MANGETLKLSLLEIKQLTREQYESLKPIYKKALPNLVEFRKAFFEAEKSLYDNQMLFVRQAVTQEQLERFKRDADKYLEPMNAAAKRVRLDGQDHLQVLRQSWFKVAPAGNKTDADGNFEFEVPAQAPTIICAAFVRKIDDDHDENYVWLGEVPATGKATAKLSLNNDNMVPADKITDNFPAITTFEVKTK